MILLLFLIFLITPVYAAGVLPAGTDAEILSDWSGGLNTNQSEHNLQKNESPDLRNVLIDESPGSIVKSRGLILSGTASSLSKITGMFPFETSDGVKSMLITDSSQVLNTSDFQTFTTVKNNLNTSVLLNCFQVRDKMWCSNGADSVFTYNRSTTVVLDGSNYGGSLGKVPNVPKFKYGIFFQGRVFGFNDSADRSGLYFSALTDTNAVIIAPDGELAWPVLNALYIGRGDGQTGTGLWIKDGLLYAGKTRSLYAIFGQDEFTYSPKKINTDVGVASNDSIAEGDGLDYFLGQDGIYKFDGHDAVRISDKITPNVDVVNKSDVNSLSNVWDTQAQFARGAFSRTTATSSGFVTLFSTQYANTANGTSVPSGSIITLSGSDLISSSETAFAVRVPTDTFPPTTFTLSAIKMWADRGTQICAQAGGSPPFNPQNTITVYVKNTNTGLVSTGTWSHARDDDGYFFENVSFPSDLEFTRAELLASNLSIKLSNQGGPCSQPTHGWSYDMNVYVPTETANATIILLSSSNGQFISEITTLTTVNAWGSFDATSNSNGGTISFFIRGSTSATHIATETWTSITPGSVIGLSTQRNYVQWASTLSLGSPQIDLVSISHIEGQGALNRAVGRTWRSRYWLLVSTESSGNTSLIYVKSRITNTVPDAWMLMDGINIRSMAVLNDVLYGGSATNGEIYRLDYGTNYNGTAVSSYYTTPSLMMGSIFTRKELLKVFLDSEKSSGLNMTLTTTYDGTTSSATTVSLDGTGRGLKTIQGLAMPRNGYAFKFKFANNQDKEWQFDSFGVLYKNTEILP